MVMAVVMVGMATRGGISRQVEVEVEVEAVVVIKRVLGIMVGRRRGGIVVESLGERSK